jgi:hypothetical protein
MKWETQSRFKITKLKIRIKKMRNKIVVIDGIKVNFVEVDGVARVSTMDIAKVFKTRNKVLLGKVEDFIKRCESIIGDRIHDEIKLVEQGNTKVYLLDYDSFGIFMSELPKRKNMFKKCLGFLTTFGDLKKNQNYN